MDDSGLGEKSESAPGLEPGILGLEGQCVIRLRHADHRLHVINPVGCLCLCVLRAANETGIPSIAHIEFWSARMPVTRSMARHTCSRNAARTRDGFAPSIPVDRVRTPWRWISLQLARAASSKLRRRTRSARFVHLVLDALETAIWDLTTSERSMSCKFGKAEGQMYSLLTPECDEDARADERNLWRIQRCVENAISGSCLCPSATTVLSGLPAKRNTPPPSTRTIPPIEIPLSAQLDKQPDFESAAPLKLLRVFAPRATLTREL